jgi:predicted MFS family arabinose efflux permease
MHTRIPLLALGTFAVGTELFVIAGLLPDIADELGVSTSTAGQLVTVFALLYALGAPVLAVLTGALTRRSLLCGALAVFAAANLVAAAAPSYGALMFARILAACGAALYTPTALGVAATGVSAERRGRALATVIAGLTAATVLGAPLGTLIASATSWRVTFVFVAALAITASLALRAGLPEVESGAVVGIRARMAVARRPAVLATLMIVATAFTGGFTLYTYIAPLAKAAAGVHGPSVVILLLASGAAALAGNVLGGFGADRWTPAKTALSAYATLAFGLALCGALVATRPARPVASGGLVVVMLFWGLGAWAPNAPMQKLLVANAMDAPAVALSLIGSANYAGIALGGAIGGAALAAVGPSAVPLAAACVEILALGLLLTIGRVATHETASRTPPRATGLSP